MLILLYYIILYSTYLFPLFFVSVDGASTCLAAMKLPSHLMVALFHIYAAAGEYIWPSELDEIEDVWSLQSGYIRNGFFDGNTTFTNPDLPLLRSH